MAMFFDDRHAAATQLAQALEQHRDKRPLVLAIPRGGVPIGAELARRLHGDLDIVMVRKLAAPGNPEFALGSVDEAGRSYLVSWAARAGLSQAFLDSERARQGQEMRRRRALYTPGRQAADVAGRTVIVVDDGLATGATMRAALHTVREGRPSWLVCAVPVASRQSLEAVRALADEVVCLHEPEDFEAVSRYYGSFPQVEDAEVVALLAQARPARADLSAQAICAEVLKERYLRPGEQGEGDVFRRVAKALASVEKASERARHEALFLQNLNAGAIGAGRIMHAAGTSLRATLLNCFVQPVGDAIQGVDADAYPGIFAALCEAAQTLACGGGVGYDFSRIRPRGALVASIDSAAAGPCAFMDVFDAACKSLQSAGSRRGAQMGVLRIDHPDVIGFIEAKGAPGRWTSFNVSVGVPDAFMQAVADDGPWELVHRAQPRVAPGEAGAQRRGDGLWVYGRLRARELWDGVMRAAYHHGEPGVLFLDAIDRDNNLRYCERIEATNPCGEQPLPPYGCCDLGPLILPRFVHHPFGFGGTPAFDWAAFECAVRIQVRALDNVLDLSHWPLPQQGAQAQAKRRIGVGFTGLANALAMLRLRYDRQEGRDMAARMARAMRDAAYDASVSLAREKGAFPRFDAEGYLAPGAFASRLPPELQQAIRTQGIRNSHLLSIAPTGSVSLAFADNASNGIEPSFAWTYQRKKLLGNGQVRVHEVQDHAWRLYRFLGGRVDALPDYFVCAQDMAAGDHIAMLQAVQPYVDSAISKTVHVRADVSYEDFHPLYAQAWRAGLKGLTAYRPDAARAPVLCVTCDRIPEQA